MPWRPKRVCRYRGCEKLTSKRYCDEYRKEMHREYNKHRRPPDTYRQYGGKWRKIRKLYIQNNPLCV